MLWQGALDTLRLPGERISSRWLGTEALMLASAPYKSTKELTEDLQLAAVKRLLPNIDQLPDDEKKLLFLHLDRLSYDQIAEIAGTSEAAVKQHLYRIRQKLIQLHKQEEKISYE